MSNQSCDEKTAKLIEEQSKKYRALMNDDQTQEMLSGFLQQTVDLIGCGPDCQKTKSSNAALGEYQKAQMALFNGPMDLENTSKTYHTVSQGEDYANQFSEERLRVVANKIGNTYLEVFDGIVETSNSLSDVYESNIINYRNSQTLAAEYENQNKDVTSLLRDTQNKASTSDRKTFYEAQEMESLLFWYRWYYYIYIIIVIVFATSMFTVKTEVPFKRQMGILLLMVLWFFLGNKAILWGIGVIKKILGLIPKNVYLTL